MDIQKNQITFGTLKSIVNMKKKYVKPEVKPYDMAPVCIMAGSVEVKAKVGVSSFFTDDDDWFGTDDSGNKTENSTYNFWD